MLVLVKHLSEPHVFWNTFCPSRLFEGEFGHRRSDLVLLRLCHNQAFNYFLLFIYLRSDRKLTRKFLVVITTITDLIFLIKWTVSLWIIIIIFFLRSITTNFSVSPYISSSLSTFLSLLKITKPIIFVIIKSLIVLNGDILLTLLFLLIYFLLDIRADIFLILNFFICSIVVVIGAAEHFS